MSKSVGKKVPKTPVRHIPAGSTYRVWVRPRGKDEQLFEFLIELQSQEAVDVFRKGLRGSRLNLTGVLKVDYTQTHTWLFSNSWKKSQK